LLSFCIPSLTLIRSFKVINSKLLRRCLEGSNENAHLRAISVLKKIVMCPTLLAITEAADPDDDDGPSGTNDDFFRDLKSSISVLDGKEAYSAKWIEKCSAKLAVFEALAEEIIDKTEEKIVVVSMSTQSLSVCQELCVARGWGFLRLDGSTPTTKRQPIIDRFNAKDCPERILLLSSKSGGAGLNVVGASRMIFLDLSVRWIVLEAFFVVIC
jgi:SNF2 family DNA or RNA helicase